MRILFVRLLLVFTVITFVECQEAVPPCPPPLQFYSGCNLLCETGNFVNPTCQGAIEDGCYCPPGFFLSRTGNCFTDNQCLEENVQNEVDRIEQVPFVPAIVEQTSSLICSNGRSFSNSATCEVFCSQRFAPPPCPLDGVPGCFCQPPNKAVRRNGDCIPVELCPSAATQSSTTNRLELTPPFPTTTTTTATTLPSFEIGTDPFVFENVSGGAVIPTSCPEGQVFSECSNCQRTCENRLLNLPCLECIPGCACPDGQLKLRSGCVFVGGCLSKGVNPELCINQCLRGQLCLQVGLQFVCV